MKFKNPFFGRRNLLVVVSSVFALYVLAWGGAVIKSKLDHNNQKRAAQARQQHINNLSQEEKSILKVQNYLVDSITTLDTAERIFLSYLQRKFNLPKTLGTDGPPIDLYEDPRTYPAEIHYIARIAYPERIVKIPPKYELDDGVKVTNIYSANCDHLTLPANYWDTAQQNVAIGGYYATHVVLASAFMKDNGCALPLNAEAINDSATREVVKLADNPATVADLRYEVVAFLLLAERRDLVQARWIEQIMAEQRQDGGWSQEVGGAKNDSHTTVLAIWSLLEYSRPNTYDEPLIRRPAN